MLYDYSNFLSLSWKIGDTLITAFRNDHRRFIDGSPRSSNHRSWLEATWIGRCGLQLMNAKRETRQAVKSRPVAQKPPCAQAAARCKQHTRHGLTCTLPGTIIISKLYNELGHSTCSSVASLCRDRRCPNIDVDILLCRERQTINSRSCKPPLSLSFFVTFTFANAQIVDSICGFHDIRMSVYFKMTRTDFITNYFDSLLF